MVPLEVAVSNPAAIALAQVCLHIFHQFPALRLFPDAVVEALRCTWVISAEDGITEAEFIYSITGVGNIIALAGMAHSLIAGQDVGCDDGAVERGRRIVEMEQWRL
jgi:hypothetical protein